MYITSSNKRGSFTANTAATTAAAAGTAATAAAVTAAATTLVATGTTAVAGGLGAGFGASLTFGLIPVETAVSAGFTAGANLGASAAPSTGSILASSVPPALAVTGTMLLIDAGTGANKNLYPNPVVLELAPKGSQVKYDPAVNLFQEKKAAEALYDRKCKIKKPGKTGHEKSDKCTQLKIDFREKRKALKSQIFPPKNAGNKDTESKAENPN